MFYGKKERKKCVNLGEEFIAAAAAAFPVDHALLDCQVSVPYELCSPPETCFRPIEIIANSFILRAHIIDFIDKHRL